MEIYLKEDCHIDWFDNNKIVVYINSGLIHNPVGGQFEFTVKPSDNFLTMTSGIGYQTNGTDNRFLNASINANHLWVSCNFNADINSSYR